MKSKLSQILSSKIVTVMLALTLFASCVVLWNTGTTEVYATETEFTVWDDETCDYAVATYSADTAKTYIGVSAPTVDNYLFAGWFTDVTCTSEYAIRSISDVTGEYCYAKFVPEDVLSTKVQVSKQDINSELDGVQRNMRFVSSVDNLGYTQIGFRMKYLDENNNWVYKINQGKVVFERIASVTEGDEYEFSPKVVDTKSEYFMTATWKGENNTGITEDEFNTNFYVRAYFTTFDGIRVYGPTRYVSVNDGLNTNIVNVSIKDENGTWNAETTELKASFSNSAGTTRSDVSVQKAYHDGTYAHLKIDLGTGVNRATELSSATKITVTDGTNAKSTIYRNLYTTYSGEGTQDTSWYAVYDGEEEPTEYIIATCADLYGMEYLANYNGGNDKVTFSGKKIYVVSDITVNKGTVSANNVWTNPYSWYPIGGFAGEFYGEGHTISGLYATQFSSTEHSASGIGLFTTTDGALVQDLTLLNSYYKVNTTNGTGAIIGKGTGTIRNVYADVIMIADAYKGIIGGIVGYATGTITIENCWSDTDIASNYKYNGGIIGQCSGVTSINHCLYSGNLSYEATTTDYVGGIVGRTSSAAQLVVFDCLDNGILTTSSTDSKLGGVIGSDDSSAGATVEKTYIIQKKLADGSLSSEISVLGNGSKATLTDAKFVKYSRTRDFNAFCDMNLSFDGYDENAYWAIRDNDTPMLISFLEESDDIIDVTGRSKTDFVIVDGVGYISTLEQLRSFRSQINSDIEWIDGDVAMMTDDITIHASEDIAAWISGDATPEETEAWAPIKGFTGTFDGQGYTINGLYTNEYSAGTGLFGNVDGAIIRNLCMEDGFVVASGTGGTALLTGYGNGTFENIKVSGFISSEKQSVGGLLGCANGDVTITNCWSDCDITSSANNFGGIVGNNTNNSANIILSHCINSGDITSTVTSGDMFQGGLVGKPRSTAAANWLGKLEIHDCLNVGIVSNEVSTKYVGGLLGYATGTYSDAYTTVVTNSHNVVQYDAEGTVVGVDNLIGTTHSTGADTAGSSCVTKDNMTGIHSYYYSNLDLYSLSNPNAYWVAREENTPILASFYNGDKLDISNLSEEVFTLTNNKGYIATANQMLNFATQMSSGDLTTDENTVVTLVSDLDMGGSDWYAIGSEGNAYKGIFDGGGHTICNLKITGIASKGSGLFTMAEGITVKNLKIIESTITSLGGNGTGTILGKGYGTLENIYVDVEFNESTYNCVGGLIGSSSGNSIIRNCWNNSDITGSGNYYGGMLGGISAGGFEITLEHCLNTGNLTYTGTSNCYYGGFIGRANAANATSGMLSMEDCLNVGVVKGENNQTYLGGLLGYAKGTVSESVTTVINNSYSAITTQDGETLGVAVAVGADNRTDKTGGEAIAKEKLIGINAFTNTELDFKTTENVTGYWCVRENETPMLTTFVSTSDTIVDVSGLSKTEFVLVDNKGTISNAEQLSSFRDQINAGSLSVDSNTVITLTDDIVVNEGTASEWADGTATLPSVWTPINGFVGLFDGNGHSISGLYGTAVSGITGIGLFTQTDGATIQNLSIENSYFKVNTSTGSGPVVGCGSGTFKNIYTEVIMIDNNSSQKGRIGGILGKASGEVVIENCWSNSQIESNWIYIGGIVGYSNAQNVSISHCLNTGDMTYTGSTASYFGGIVGSSCSSSATSYTGCLQITDCLNTGTVRGATSETYMGGVIGNAGGLDASGNATVLITNSYATINYDDDNQQIGINILVGNGLEASITDCAVVNYDQSIGEYAYDSMDLDFVTESNEDGYWVVRDGDTPMLTSFFQ